MNLKRKIPLWATATALALGGPVALIAPVLAAPVEDQDQQGAEVLTRGPVHEAFAETVSYNPAAGLIVKKAPPAAIEEMPPDQQLQGDNVSWIPGYWAWDDDRGDFLWVSGIWRNLPPGRQWVPGYWNQAEDGYQWISGYWADSQSTEVSYLPEPPPSLESGPNIAADSDDQTWAPGSYYWNDDRYVWRPGYWQTAQPNWIWCPGHYNWTPRGYIFVDGYWDYAVARRGVLFAPVYFSHDYYSRPGFSYSPLTVISLAVFAEHLFLRPSYGHYYFGDYYDPRYRNNYYAPYAFNSGRQGFDPFFAHQRWENRRDRNWLQTREKDFTFYRDNAAARPPQTFAAFRALAPNAEGRKNFAIASTLAQYTKSQGGVQKFQALSADRRTKIVTQEKQVQAFTQERQKLEVAGRGNGKEGNGKRVDVEKAKWTPSPVIGKPVERFAKSDAPPKKPVAAIGKVPGAEPKVDPKVDPNGKVIPRDNVPEHKVIPRDNTPERTIPPKGTEPEHKVIPRDNTPERTIPPKGTEPERKVIPRDNTPDRTVIPKNPEPERKVIPRDNTPERAVVPKNTEPERKVIPRDNTPERSVVPKNVEPERKVAPRENVPERAVTPKTVEPERKVEPRTAPGGPANPRDKGKDKDN